MSADPALPTSQSMRTLHRTLLAGGCVILAVFMTLVFVLHTGPLLSDGPGRQVIGLAAALAGLSAVARGYLVPGRRVPERLPGQSLDAYWQAGAAGPSVLCWVMLEGGSVMTAVGFLLSSHLLPLGVSWAALAALAAVGPAHFEERQRRSAV